jgi:outer membrane protein TolC
MIVWIILFAPALRAQVITLKEVLSLIDGQNPELQQYSKKAQGLTEYSQGATSWMPPMVGVGTYMTPYPGQRVMEPRDRGSVMFSIEQDIPNPAKLKATRNYLASMANLEAQGRAVKYNALRAQAKSYYYQWLVAERKLRVLKENEEIIDLMLKVGRIRYPYRQDNLGNIYKAEGRLAEVQNMILMTRAEIEGLGFRLKSLASIPATDTIMVDTAMVVRFTPSEIRSDTATLNDSRSDLKQIEASIRSMQLNQAVQRFGARPDFRIRFDHMQPIGNMPSQFSAMAMVSIPIAPWSSKMYRAEVRGMSYEIEGMKKERDGILLETKGMLAAMASELKGMDRQLENYRSRIIPALRKNYNVLMLAYEENRGELPTVLDGWEALNMAQMEYLDKLSEYYLTIVKYEEQVEK